ncbi:MAG: hypothetical protein JXQ71_12385 [Verrucomicrobia bacterium]|nr:hypothetical protein [Verrucomicrobiota bacterium]
MESHQHSWTFFRSGGVDQVAFLSGADIWNLEHLDQKLWVALAMPTRGIEFDPKTLDHLDTDKDGRIRAPEVLAAVQWLKEVYKDPNGLLKGGDSVPLSAIHTQTPAGTALLAGARRILQSLSKPDAMAISIADIADTVKIFAQTKLNGDGVVPAEAADDAKLKQAIEDIISAVGSVPDRSGKPGLNPPLLETFFTQAKTFAEWHAKAGADKTIHPLTPDATAAAAAAIHAVKAKVDDYFARCRLAAFDPRALTALNRQEAEYLDLAAKDLTISAQEVAGFPLARIEPKKALPLGEGLNPAWIGAIRSFVTTAVVPLLGGSKPTLSEDDWAAVQAKIAPFDAWTAAKPATGAETLGVARVRELLAGNTQSAIAQLIQADAALEPEYAQILAVEKLVYFQRDFFKLLDNYVNFADFYGRKGAVFQAGTLYLDGRSCKLCVHVSDAAKHAALAGLSQAYLAYCDCTRPGGQKLSIVAAFTQGDSDHLMVGRNGIFYDRQSRDWDATITRIVANPISIREAFWMPYKKAVRAIEDMIAKRAAAAESASAAKLTTAAQAAATADKPPAAAPLPAKKMDVGTVAAIGVALGSIGTFLGLLLGKFIELGIWMPIAFVALILLISGPAMLLAYLKLRLRNIGPILDANGWAINGRAKINVAFGKAMTDMAALPPGSRRSLQDPYADKKSVWRWLWFPILLVILAALWYFGSVDRYLPARVKSTAVLGTNAPAYRAAQTPAGVPSTKPPAAKPE